MDRSTKVLLFLAGLGIGGMVGTYVLLRKHREKIEQAAARTRQVADQTERLARALEGLDRALGPVGPAEEEPVPEE